MDTMIFAQSFKANAGTVSQKYPKIPPSSFPKLNTVIRVFH